STTASLSAPRTTSTRMAIAWPPARSTVSTVFLAAASSMSATTTRAPSRANPRAVAAPIPEPAPVTTATRSCSFMAPRPFPRYRRSRALQNELGHQANGIDGPRHLESRDAGGLPLGEALADALGRPTQCHLVDEGVRDGRLRLSLATGEIEVLDRPRRLLV